MHLPIAEEERARYWAWPRWWTCCLKGKSERVRNGKMTCAPNQNAKSNKSSQRIRHSPLLLLSIELMPCYCCRAKMMDLLFERKERKGEKWKKWHAHQIKTQNQTNRVKGYVTHHCYFYRSNWCLVIVVGPRWWTSCLKGKSERVRDGKNDICTKSKRKIKQIG